MKLEGRFSYLKDNFRYNKDMARKLTPELLEYLAELARLSLSSREKKELLSELNKILEAFSDIRKASSIQHLASSGAVKLSQLKSKKALIGALADGLLARAPDKKGRYFRVPKVGRLE